MTTNTSGTVRSAAPRAVAGSGVGISAAAVPPPLPFSSWPLKSCGGASGPSFPPPKENAAVRAYITKLISGRQGRLLPFTAVLLVDEVQGNGWEMAGAVPPPLYLETPPHPSPPPPPASATGGAGAEVTHRKHAPHFTPAGTRLLMLGSAAAAKNAAETVASLAAMTASRHVGPVKLERACDEMGRRGVVGQRAPGGYALLVREGDFVPLGRRRISRALRDT